MLRPAARAPSSCGTGSSGAPGLAPVAGPVSLPKRTSNSTLCDQKKPGLLPWIDIQQRDPGCITRALPMQVVVTPAACHASTTYAIRARWSSSRRVGAAAAPSPRRQSRSGCRFSRERHPREHDRFRRGGAALRVGSRPPTQTCLRCRTGISSVTPRALLGAGSRASRRLLNRRMEPAVSPAR
jgi:hypothetical protein